MIFYTSLQEDCCNFANGNLKVIDEAEKVKTNMHEENHFVSSNIVKDVVIGMADGLTVPFALAAGLSGAVDSNIIVITAGIAEIIAGSIAMGLGGYLAGKTDIDHYHSELNREYEEVDHVPEKEMQEIKDVLGEY
ncbi:MAG: VIT1/CCC1 transporter family protein, partial [Chitinophagales bacterium]